MTFTCIICHRSQPIGLGRPMSSGLASWVCTDTDDCQDAATSHGGWLHQCDCPDLADY